MGNEKDLSSVDSESPEFKMHIQKIIEEATWGKGGPMTYVDDEGWIVRHWKDGRIEKISDTNARKSKPLSDIVRKYKTQRQAILFEEEPTAGYKMRTIKNATADVTFAFATDFSTSGEKLTKSATIDQGKKYVDFNVNDMSEFHKGEIIILGIFSLNECNAKTLNIAGNGIYTMKGKYTQQEVDDFTFEILQRILTSPLLNNKIELIRSGGQTGFDEAGIKAAVKLGIPALILAPKGWGFRGIDGVDIYDEVAFKKRFNTI